MEKYKLLSPLGEGTFASVFKAMNKETGEVVTVKRMKKLFETWEECIQLREVRLLQKYGHQNIRRLREVIRVQNQLYLIFDYMDGTIYDMIKASRKQENGLYRCGLNED